MNKPMLRYIPSGRIRLKGERKMNALRTVLCFAILTFVVGVAASEPAVQPGTTSDDAGSVTSFTTVQSNRSPEQTTPSLRPEWECFDDENHIPHCCHTEVPWCCSYIDGEWWCG
jgi:hypothetical protein